jgi:hypothetical protein
VNPEVRRDLQCGIGFLVGLDLTDVQRRALPSVPDYEALADQARREGLNLSALVLEEAFRLLIQARIIGSRSPD